MKTKGSTADSISGKTVKGFGVLLLLVALLTLATHCGAQAPNEDKVGVGITGIDHLDEHLSIQNFWVDGFNAAQAGKGGSTVCCAMLPQHWRPGLSVHVRWGVTNWRDKTFSMHERDVPVERYETPGHLWVHFLRDGSVRVVTTQLDTPLSPTYPGPHDPIPDKDPWHKYPRAPDEPMFKEVKDARQGG